MAETKEDFKNDYRMEYWRPVFGSDPIRTVEHRDTSESYEMNAAHVFELENGQYALVTESGCSCYSSSDAQIDLYPTERKAVEAFEEWFKRG